MALLLDLLRELTATVSRSVPRVAQLVELDDIALTSAVAELARARHVLEASTAQLYAEVARRSARELGHAGLAAAAGYNDAAKFLQAQTGSSYSDARKLIDSGELLAAAESVAPAGVGVASVGPTDGASPPTPAERLAALALLPGPWDACVGVALRDGLLGHEQARAIRAGLKRPRDDSGTAAWRRAALELIREAVESRADADALLRAARLRHGALDRDEAARLSETRWRRRRAERFVQSDGMVLWKLLADPESDAKLKAAIDAITAPRRGVRFVSAEAVERSTELERDPRTLEQLQFDAVFGIITAGIDTDPKRISDPAPVVRILVTREELRADGIARLEGSSHPLSYAAVARNICDSGYLPIVFDSAGQPIDVGRRVRTFTPRQREALAARDGGCRAPGCTRPPSQCEAHHIVEWADGGRTDLDNGILLCRFHHLNLHNSGGRITRESDPATGRHRFWEHRPGTPPRLLPTKSVALR